MPDTDALARRFLHVNLNTRSLDASEALYDRVLGLSARMRTDKSVASDGSILGMSGETFCETSFLYDSRGGRGGCALEVIEYHDPALAVDTDHDPLRPGLRSALMTVADLDETVRALAAAGVDAGERVDGLISGAPAVLVTDPDGVVVEISEVTAGTSGALFDGIRMATHDVGATADFLAAIGFEEIEAPAERAIAGRQLAPGGGSDMRSCRVARYALPEDGDRFSLLVVENEGTASEPVPWGGNRQGLYRCALRVESVEAALAQVPSGVQIMGSPVWCPLPGTKIDGLYIAFLRSPEGVVFEFVERPLSYFTR